MRSIAPLLAALVVFSNLGPRLLADEVILPQYGFALAPLDAPPSASQITVCLMMFLPVTDRFSPNVNVTIQPHAGSMQEYIDRSKGQFNEMEFSLIRESSPNENEWTVEYTGEMQGSPMHFYARALAAKGRVYLVTATSAQSQWEAVGDTLRANVDSFRTLDLEQV